MKLIYTLFFLLIVSIASAQNDSIYPTQKILHVGDTLKMVFKSKSGSMELMSNGACTVRVMAVSQFKKPTGWGEIYHPAQMDCGMPTVNITNGSLMFYKQNYPGTYRMVFFSSNGRYIETEEFTVIEE